MDDPRIRQENLFDSILLGFRRLSKDKPLLLFLDDLQWADPSTLSLLHYLARNTRNHEVLIIGTYRPEDIKESADGEVHSLEKTIQIMNRETLLGKIELGRLDARDTEKLIASALGEASFDKLFLDKIYEETEGTPFFILEVLKLLEEEGCIRQDEEGVWKLFTETESLDIPSQIYDVIARRLNGVERENRRLLEYASVVGVVFTSTILGAVLNIERIRLLEQLRDLEQTHKLIHSHNGSFKFDHTKIKEVIYSDIPAELRMEYHAIIAEALENLNKENLDGVIGDLAFHYFLCRNREKASFYLIKAAENARNEYSNTEAIRFYDEALELEDDLQKRTDIYESQGTVFDLMSNYEKSIESYERALESIKGNKRSAKIKANMGEVYRKKGTFDKAIEICTEALSLVKGEETEEEALALRVIGNVHADRGEYGSALEQYGKSLIIHEKINDRKGFAFCLNNIGTLFMERGDYDRAVENYEKSLEIREEIDDQYGIGGTFNNIGGVHHTRGDYDGALEYYNKGLEIFEKINNRVGIAICLNNIGVIYSDRREYDRVLEHYEKSLEIREMIGDQRGIGYSLNNIGSLYLENEEYDKALEYFEKSLEIGEKVGDRMLLMYNYYSNAEIYYEKGDMQKALDFCQRVYDLSKEMGIKENIACSSRIFGMVYREQEKWTESVENFEESVKILEEIKGERELGNTHYEFGLMWKAKGDLDKSKEHLNKAVEIFEGLKLEKELEEAAESLRNLEN